MRCENNGKDRANWVAKGVHKRVEGGACPHPRYSHLLSP